MLLLEHFSHMSCYCCQDLHILTKRPSSATFLYALVLECRKAKLIDVHIILKWSAFLLPVDNRMGCKFISLRSLFSVSSVFFSNLCADWIHITYATVDEFLMWDITCFKRICTKMSSVRVSAQSKTDWQRISKKS